MTRTDTALGALAVALLWMGALAPLFGAALRLGNTAPEFQCSKCGWSGHWWGTRCPHCGK
jgi:Zn finger protein HypA/HybF involved in hydrogenase expression